MRSRTRCLTLVGIISVLSAAGPLAGGADFPICTAPGWQYLPAASGTIVVWQDSRNLDTSGWDIYGYDIATAKEFPVCTAPGHQEAPDVWGNVVVWTDERDIDSTGSDIYGCCLDTRREFTICTRPGNQSRPVVAGTIVIWEDWRDFHHSGPDLYGRDLSTGEEFELCSQEASQRRPAASEEVAAWEDWRSDPGDSSDPAIRARDISQRPLPPSPPSPATSPPAAYDKDLQTAEDTPATVVLGPARVGAIHLTYAVVVQPAHGTLHGAGPMRTYSPDPEYSGVDTFYFKANDGRTDSNIAAVTIAVIPVNDSPVALPTEILALKGSARTVTLSATDAEGDPLAYIIVDPPDHGALHGTGAVRTYLPEPGYAGPDRFLFKANDGRSDSSVAAVNISLRSENHAPVARSQRLGVSPGSPTPITLSAYDEDGDALTYTAVAGPAHGTLSGPVAAGCLTYISDPGYLGPDRFAFKAADSLAESNVAAVSLTIGPEASHQPSAIPSETPEGGCPSE